MPRIRAGFFLSFLLLLPSTLYATTYYVATNGLDTNAGTIAAPFRTINQAQSPATAGDTIYVRGGIYNERFVIWESGTSSARLTIAAYPGEHAIIDGTGTSASTSLVSLGSDYVDFSGFEVRNSTDYGIVCWGCTNTRIVNNRVHSSKRGAIYVGDDTFGAAHDVLVAGNNVYNNVLENEARTWTSGWAQAISIHRGNNVTVRENVVYRNYSEGIAFIMTDNSVAAANELFDNWAVGIYLDNAQSVKVDGNLVYSTGNARYYRNSKPSFGIMMANEDYGSEANVSNGNHIINNVIVRQQWGLAFFVEDTGGMTNCYIANNTVYATDDISGTGTYMLFIEADAAHSGNLVENNIFARSSSSTVTMTNVTGTGVTYRNNFWTVNPGAPAYSSTTDAISTSAQFVNPGGVNAEDYRLLSTSAAINTGRTLTYVTNDYWRRARGTTYEMGAWTY
ncbi:MAG TPA: right-handed parallel beta-helix repeat-containing protein [Thermoanaerobaculia bacterium]|nr:right-handed parallel beta-helix repeat-containing protein [Thermoanaerobaculia bacterium]